MHFREAFHSSYALGLAGLFSSIGFALTVNHHLLAGLIICWAAVFCFVGWAATLPESSVLMRLWVVLISLIASGIISFQVIYDEDQYQLSLPHGVLVPAADKIILSKCGHEKIQDGSVGVLIGSNIAVVSQPVQTVLWFGQNPVVTIKKTDLGILLDMNVYDQNGEKVLSVSDNNIVVNHNSVMEFLRSDFSSIAIIDKNGRNILSVRFSNRNFIKIDGLILYSSETVVVDKIQTIFEANSSVSNSCANSFSFGGDGSLSIR